MSFYDDEAGVETSKPREGFKITHGVTVYRLTNSVKDEIIAGEVYTATPIDRTEMGVHANGADHDVSFKLPVTHPFVQRYLERSVPPKRINVEMRRLQADSGDAELFWHGEIASVSISKQIASFLVLSTAGRNLKKRLPVLSVSKSCPHVLYGVACGVVKNDHKVTTTVSQINGREVTVASIGGHPNYWAQYGELLHVASGETMTVFDQVAEVLTLQFPLHELKIGDSVEVYAGCSHEILTCRTTFANQVNFGGMPELPDENPHLTNGFGTYTEA